MKLGVISDLHGDLVALELAWSHLILLGADRIVSAGDSVGYGPRPDETVEFLRERTIATIRGNHDRWAIDRGALAADPFGGGPPSERTIEYLRELPDHLVFADSDDPRVIVVVVHGTYRSDMEFVTRTSHPPQALDSDLETLRADVLIHGHTHRPMFYRSSRGVVVNPGSVISAPVVETSRTFALLDLITLETAFYDVESARPVEVKPWTAGASRTRS